MKTTLLLTPIVASIILSAACSGGDRASLSPTGPVLTTLGSSAGDRTVSGSGVVTQRQGVVYRLTISARKGSNGETSGNMTTHIDDLTGFGVAGKFTIVGRIDCLEFGEDAVWFGGEEVAVNDPLISAPGGRIIGKIEKKNGQDYAFGGPAAFYVAPGTRCTDRPNLATFEVRDGGYQIR
jgi:hypothetical protein